MTKKTESVEPAPLCKVRILTDNHTHRGEIVPPGTVLELDEATTNWLIGANVAEAVKEG